MESYLIVIIAIIAVAIYAYFTRKKSVTNAKSQTIDSSVPTTTRPLLEIQSFNSPDVGSYTQVESLPLTNSLKDNLGNVFKISSQAKDIVATEKKVIVKFSEEIQKKLMSGELKVMQKKGAPGQLRTIVVDGKHRIRGHGWVETKDIKKINPAQLGNAVFGVMTIITAQEHLDKINKQLNNIDKKIDTLIRQYNNDKVGNIQGNIRYLKSILPSLQSTDEKLSIYLTKIEDISLTSYTEMESILKELPHLLEDASKIKEKTKFEVNKILPTVQDLTSAFEQKILIGYGNLEVMSICLKLSNDIGNNTEVSMNRVKDIEHYFKQFNDYHKQFENILKEKNQSLNATFRRNKTIDSKKEELTKHLSHHYETINSNMTAINQHIVQLKNPDKPAISGPVDLQVEFDDMNNIKAVYRLKEKTSTKSLTFP